jgi:hypothetical protein
MRREYSKYLAAGAGHGSGYSLCLRQGMFEGAAGARLGARSGSSLEFMEHRDYMPGDDLRTLDWNVYARTEHLTVKMFREEINPRLDIIIDGSASMDIPESPKAEAALGLAGLLTTAAANASFITRAWTLTDKITPVINGANPVEQWDGIEFTDKPDFSSMLSGLPGNLYHHGIRIVISDLLWSLEPKHFLHRLCAGAAAVVLIQVLNRADLTPEEYGNVRLCDSETGQAEELFVDAGAVRKYKAALNRHQDNWYRVSRESGTFFITLEAEELISNWNLEKLIAHRIVQAT